MLDKPHGRFAACWTNEAAVAFSSRLDVSRSPFVQWRRSRRAFVQPPRSGRRVRATPPHERASYLSFMRVRNILAIGIAVLVGAGCIWAGSWQLDRRAQRLAINALATARMKEPPARSLGELGADTGAARYRPVELSGAFDFEHELILTGRSHQGSPGVNLITPLRIQGEGRAVLVNRGWVYAPDGATVDAGRWREPVETTVRGYALPFSDGDGGVTVRARSVRRLVHDTVAALVPYPLAPIYVVDTAAGGSAAETPAPLGGVVLDAGPHLGYAVQWFSFAAIALVGVGLLVWRDRRPRPAHGAGDVATVGRAG